jgi:hypothetical protein
MDDTNREVQILRKALPLLLALIITVMLAGCSYTNNSPRLMWRINGVHEGNLTGYVENVGNESLYFTAIVVTSISEEGEIIGQAHQVLNRKLESGGKQNFHFVVIEDCAGYKIMLSQAYSNYYHPKNETKWFVYYTPREIIEGPVLLR